ncbi:hypothetical protein Gotur_030208 [Gossypium turneri]
MWCLNGFHKHSQEWESYTIFFAEIERRSYLSFGKVEHMGNEMAFALAIAGFSVRIPLKHSGESVEENGSIGLCLISCSIFATMYSV